MAKFFIDRPIFAWVIAIIIMLAGVLSLVQLPVQQYPTIAPPSVRVSANYPGASAKILEDSVTQVIEQNMTGLDGLLYMSSQSNSSGNVTINLTFAPGTNPDIAQVQVQNKLSLAEALLPQEVQQQGISVNKASSSFLMVVGLISSDGKLTRNDLSDFANSQLKEPLSRTPGVGEIRVFGAQYAMRIWLQPEKTQRLWFNAAGSASGRRGTEYPICRRPAGWFTSGGKPAAERHHSGANPPGRCRSV